MKLTLTLLTVLLEARLAVGSLVIIGEPELVVRQGPSGPPPSASSKFIISLKLHKGLSNFRLFKAVYFSLHQA